ncbi:MAG: hypothetical protein RL885_21780 [Planctomycetota bacterium]
MSTRTTLLASLLALCIATGCSTTVLKKGAMELTTSGRAALQFDEEGEGQATIRNEGPGTILVAILDEQGGVQGRETLAPREEKKMELVDIQRIHFENQSDQNAAVFFEVVVNGIDEIIQIDLTR